MITEQEQRQWCEMMGKTKQQQLDAIKELLHHAAWDEMSTEDRVICRNQQKRLEKELASCGAH